MARTQNSLYFMPIEHTTTPNFGKMHINPFIAFRIKVQKYLLQLKYLTQNWVKTAKLWGL